MGQKDIKHQLVVRPFDFSRDYDTISQWWEEHNSFAPKPEHLSTTGIIVEADIPLCAGWLYKTDSKICVFEFVVSNPKADKEIRDASLELLIESIKKISKEQGYKLIYSSVKGLRYIMRLQQQGFVVVDEHQTHCFCEV